MNYSQDESAQAIAKRAGVQRRFLKKRVAERRVIHKVHSLCLDPQEVKKKKKKKKKLLLLWAFASFTDKQFYVSACEGNISSAGA